MAKKKEQKSKKTLASVKTTKTVDPNATATPAVEETKKVEETPKVEEPKVQEPASAPTQETTPPPVDPTPEKKEDQQPTEEKKPVEEKKEEKNKKQKKSPAPNVEPTTKNEETIVAEEVNPEEEKKVPATKESIGHQLRKLNPGDRIDANHVIDLAKMVQTAYLSNPATPAEKAKMMRQQFDVMTAVALVTYATQLEDDLTEMNVKIKPEMREQAETILKDCLDIKVIEIPQKDGQLMLGFKEIPEDVKVAAKQAKKAAEDPIPEPDPNMSEKDKETAIRAICSRKDKISGNIMNAIAWVRKAFSIPKETADPLVLAKMLHKYPDLMIMKCIGNAPMGKFSSDRSIIGVHALTKSWFQQLTDAEVANITKVITSYSITKRVNDLNDRGTKYKTDENTEFSIINKQIAAANTEEILKAIAANEESKAITIEGQQLPTIVKPSAVHRMMTIAYGELSENLMMDKLKELVGYYKDPFVPFSTYLEEPKPATTAVA